MAPVSLRRAGFTAAVSALFALAPVANAQSLNILSDDSHDTNGDELTTNFSDFADHIRGLGHTIEELDGAPGAITSEALECVDMLIVNDPDSPLTVAEIAAIHAFVDDGGCVLVLGENGGAVDTASLNTLLAPYGMEFNGITDQNPDFAVPVGMDPITAGVTAVRVDSNSSGGYDNMVLSMGAIELLEAGSRPNVMAIDVSRKVIAIGDSDLFKNSAFDPDDNESRLIENILDNCPVRPKKKLSDARKPGSVLVYPVHRSAGGSAATIAPMFTILCVTNTNTTPATPASLGGAINLHYEYVNVQPGTNPFMPQSCVIFDRHEFLTPADTICVLTSCHNAVSPAGQEGYVVVSAQDPSLFNVPVSHNYLIGSEFVISASGVAYSINAYSIQSPLAAGLPTDVNNNGQLDFNGIEYTALPDTLMIDSFVALAGSQLALVNMTGRFEDKNDLLFAVWNDNEYALSATLRFGCWFDQPLTTVSPLFADSFLAALPNDPGELDINCDGVGDLETGWASIQSRGVFSTGGERIADDGAFLGSITAGMTTSINGGRLLWESTTAQTNGTFHGRPTIVPPPAPF